MLSAVFLQHRAGNLCASYSTAYRQCRPITHPTIISDKHRSFLFHIRLFSAPCLLPIAPHLTPLQHPSPRPTPSLEYALVGCVRVGGGRGGGGWGVGGGGGGGGGGLKSPVNVNYKYIFKPYHCNLLYCYIAHGYRTYVYGRLYGDAVHRVSIVLQVSVLHQAFKRRLFTGVWPHVLRIINGARPMSLARVNELIYPCGQLVAIRRWCCSQSRVHSAAQRWRQQKPNGTGCFSANLLGVVSD